MHHGHGHVARTWKCSMDMDMQNGHAAVQHRHPCSVDMDMQHGYEHEHRPLEANILKRIEANISFF
jgi:hypothetical protein